MADVGFHRVVLNGATLSGARLSGVEITTTVGLTSEQISGAVTDARTKLPTETTPK